MDHYHHLPHLKYKLNNTNKIITFYEVIGNSSLEYLPDINRLIISTTGKESFPISTASNRCNGARMRDKTHCFIGISIDWQLDYANDFLLTLVGKVLIFKFGVGVFWVYHKQFGDGTPVSWAETGALADEFI